MIDLAVYNAEGNKVDSVNLDEASLGGVVNYPLLKQAIVMYHANKRVGTAASKGRGDKAGSGRKLFRQKGTGSARVGNSRTGKRVGGGATFAKSRRDFSKKMPRKQKRQARNSAILDKVRSNDVVLVDEIKFEEPKTSQFAQMLRNLQVQRSCVVATSEFDNTIYKSARNIPGVAVMVASQLNAGDICNRHKLVMTKGAFLSIVESGDKSES